MVGFRVGGGDGATVGKIGLGVGCTVGDGDGGGVGLLVGALVGAGNGALVGASVVFLSSLMNWKEYAIPFPVLPSSRTVSIEVASG